MKSTMPHNNNNRRRRMWRTSITKCNCCIINLYYAQLLDSDEHMLFMRKIGKEMNGKMFAEVGRISTM